MQGTEGEAMIGRDRIDAPIVLVFAYGDMVLYGLFSRA
jgi:hypothetical protein